MYRDRDDNGGSRDRFHSDEDIYSKPVKAGKRTYFFDVKSTKGGDFYLTITESKRKVGPGGEVSYEKHKVFLYKEDFIKFSTGLEDAIQYIRDHAPEGEDPSTWEEDGENRGDGGTWNGDKLEF